MDKTLKILLCWVSLVSLSVAACTTGASGNCEVGSGKTYATIANCLSAAAAGQTCQVFGSVTYTENPTIPPGSVGQYIALLANPGDAPTIAGTITINSHTKFIGACAPGSAPHTAGCFTVQNVSSPTTSCVNTGGTTITDFFLTGNIYYECGGINFTANAVHNSLGYIGKNTLSYMSCLQGSSGTNGCLNASYGTGAAFPNIHCDGCLIEYNDVSHVSDIINEIDGSNNVTRHNNPHDALGSECGNNSSNCHIDFYFSETNFGGGGYATAHNTIESNTMNNCNDSAGCHMYLQQADVCAGHCRASIFRFNQGAHVSTSGLTNDNQWLGMYLYNNTELDVAVNFGGSGAGGIADTCSNGATNCNYLNNIYYYIGSITNFNAIGNASGSHGTGTITQIAGNLAFCTISCGGLWGPNYGSNSPSWTGSGQLIVDPQLVAPNTGGTALGNNALRATSPARNAGVALTTVNGTIVNSTALVVADAGFFQANAAGIAGVQNDCIAVTTITHAVCIASINYGTNTVTLSSPISATNGDPVYIYSITDGTKVLTDTTGPDIGAVPFTPTTAGAAVDGYAPAALPCGPPLYYCSPSNSSAVVPLPATPPFTGLTGAGTMVAAPEPGNPNNIDNVPLCRLTDNSSTFQNTSHTMAPNKSGNGFDYAWNENDTWLFTADSGANIFFWSADPTQANICASATQQFQLTNAGGQPNFSTVTPNLYYMEEAGGSGVVTVSGTAVSWVSGTQFLTLWAGETMVANGGSCSIQTVNSATSITLASVGTCASGSYTVGGSKIVSANPNSPSSLTSVFDFATCNGWNALLAANGMSDPPTPNNGDLAFATGFESGGQDTGRLVTAYIPGTGCYLINLSSTQMYGPSGLIGMYNPAHGTMKIHQIDPWRGAYVNVARVNAADAFALTQLTNSAGTTTITYIGPLPDGTQMIAGENMLISGTTNYNGTFALITANSTTATFAQTCSGCGTETSGTATVQNDNNGDPFLWLPGASDLSYNCNGSRCSGHHVGGVSHFFNDTNQTTFAMKLPGGAPVFTFPPTDPCAGHQSTWDTHPTINPTTNDANEYVLFGSTSGNSLPDYTKPCTAELMAILPSGTATFEKRWAHLFSLGSWSFDIDESIVMWSQTGRFASFGSTMANSLGDVNSVDNYGAASASGSGSTVTLTTTGSSWSGDYANGKVVNVANCSVAGYNGTQTLTGVAGANMTFASSTTGAATGCAVCIPATVGDGPIHGTGGNCRADVFITDLRAQ